MFQLESTEELSLMTLKSDGKLWFQIWNEEFGEFSRNHSKSKVQKFYFDGYFYPKYMKFELKNAEQLSSMTLDSDAKFE